MSAGTSIDEALRLLLRARCAWGADAGLGDEVPLGPGGLGLDSIGIGRTMDRRIPGEPPGSDRSSPR